jgi:hypothetical protein
MKDAIKRILASQKAIYAMVPVFANVIAQIAGVDPTTPLLLALDAAFALLLLVQFCLDLRWGSPSDRSGIFKVAPLLLAGVLLAGCTTTGALYKDERRTVLGVESVGIGSFCFAGLEIGSIVILPAFGWGDLDCGDVISPQSPEATEEPTPE